MAVITLNKNNFSQEVLSSDKPVLVDFWASWCGPCRMLSPIIEEIAAEHQEIKVGKINVDEERELAQEFQIMSIPTLILFKDGKPAASSLGAVPKASVEAMIKGE